MLLVLLFLYHPASTEIDPIAYTPSLHAAVPDSGGPRGMGSPGPQGGSGREAVQPRSFFRKLGPVVGSPGPLTELGGITFFILDRGLASPGP